MENLFYQPEIINGVHHLDPDESKHCVKVLRKKAGDALTIIDGQGNYYEAVITHANIAACQFSIRSTQQMPQKNYSIHLAVSPTKNSDRMEWMVEKCVELGVDEFSFLQCMHSERLAFKTGRIERVAINALKQSQQARLPKINPLAPFKEFVKSLKANTARYIAYVDQSNPDHLMKSASAKAECIVLIGPEGDFTDEELAFALEHGFQKVSLGLSRLRTETAGLAACHILNLVNL